MVDHFLEEFLNPKSIALFGANENLMQNMGSQQLLNILDNGYKGNVYPIHPNLDEVMGLKAFKTISELPEIPDLAIVILPTRIIPQIFEEIGEKGTKNVVLVTAGFRETDNIDAEQQLNAIAKKFGFRFMGPNCLGYINTHTHYSKENPEKECILNFTWVTYATEPGNVSIASQSGTFVAHINFITEERDLNMSKCLSIGNRANIDVCACLEYFEQDPETEVILLYIEDIKRGRYFMELCKRISLKKPIVAYYAGGSKGGAHAVSSHTGSVAGNDQIFNAVFEESGVIRVDTLEEMFDTAVLFSKLIPLDAIPKNNRLAIVTNAGGPGATMADRASRLGIEIPQFSEKLQEKLKKYLPHTAQGSQASNPLDYTFSIDPSTYFERVPKLIAKSGEVDAIVGYGAYGPDFFRYRTVGKEFMKTEKSKKLIKLYMDFLEASVENSRRIVKKYKLPIVYVNLLGYYGDKVVDFLNKNAFPTYKMPHQAVIALNNVMKYGKFLAKSNRE